MNSIARLSGCEFYFHPLLAFTYENPDFNPFGLLPGILLKEDRGMCVYFYLYMCKHICVCMCVHKYMFVCVYMCVLVCICFMYMRECLCVIA